MASIQRRARRCALLTIALAVPAGAAGALPIRAETEPNGTTATADPLSRNPGVGDISSGGLDVDVWSSAFASEGDLVFVLVSTARSTTSNDSFLEVLDAGGAVIGSDDNDGPMGPGSGGSAVAGAEVPVGQGGNVFFRITQEGMDDDITPYEIYRAVVDPTLAADEAEDNGFPGLATLIEIGQLATGTIPFTDNMDGTGTGSDDDDYFAFAARAGDVVVVLIDEDPDRDGKLPDTELSILDIDGVTELPGGNDDGISGSGGAGDANSAGPVEIPTDGFYFVWIRDGTGGGIFPNPDDDYRFVVVPEPTPGLLAVAALSTLALVARRSGRRP
jgi:hypothetical protein